MIGSFGVSEESRYLELELPTGPVPLGFAAEGSSVYLVGRDRAARWPVQALREGVARLRLPHETLAGAVELVTDDAERARVLELFRTRYGVTDFDRWYANPARVLRVSVRSSGTTLPGPEHYRGWLESEFDNVAVDYDRHITGNRINRLLRDRSLNELRRSFQSAHRILEIGCGSGMETLPLLGEGHELVCLDISARMLDVVREKARRAGVSERLETVHAPASRIPSLPSLRASGPFDGAYSTYGALNCEPDLPPIARALASLLRPDAPFVAGVYNRFCAFELVGYGLTGRLSRAAGRARHQVPVGASRFCVDIFALSAPEFEDRFRPWFRVERVQGVPVLLPPSDLVGYTEKLATGFSRLARWDEAVGRSWPFRLFGDHFLMTLRRRAGLPPEP
jgi:SAM-dependent methyltransferase